jgi:hypothetical protein
LEEVQNGSMEAVHRGSLEETFAGSGSEGSLGVQRVSLEAFFERGSLYVGQGYGKPA